MFCLKNSIHWIIDQLSKPNKDITKKEYFKLITLMNTHAEIPNKILSNQIQ